jgi:hypothetical protein
LSLIFSSTKKQKIVKTNKCMYRKYLFINMSLQKNIHLVSQSLYCRNCGSGWSDLLHVNRIIEFPVPVEDQDSLRYCEEKKMPGIFR